MAGRAEKDLGTTDTGLKPQIAGVFCYLLGFVTGLIFILIEKKNQFVRFHAMQSIIVFAGLFVVNAVLTLIPVLGPLASALIGLASVALWVVLMVKAYQGEQFKLPVVGDIAEKNI